MQAILQKHRTENSSAANRRCDEQEKKLLQMKYELMSVAEVSASLEVPVEDILALSSLEVNCVTCRMGITHILTSLPRIGLPDLKPYCLINDGFSFANPMILTAENKIVVAEDCVNSLDAIADLFCTQLFILQSVYEKFLPKKRKLRCLHHASGAGNESVKANPTSSALICVWKNLDDDIREDLLTIPFCYLHATLEDYMDQQHLGDDLCRDVYKALDLLMTARSPATSSWSDGDEQSQAGAGDYIDAYKNLTVMDTNVHVNVSLPFISDLIELAVTTKESEQPHFSHLDLGTKVVLTCIGFCVRERFVALWQKLSEVQYMYHIVYLLILKTLKKSFLLAFESKQGCSDLELLCRELDLKEKRRQIKAQKKRDKKKKSKEASRKQPQESIASGSAASADSDPSSSYCCCSSSTTTVLDLDDSDLLKNKSGRILTEKQGQGRTELDISKESFIDSELKGFASSLISSSGISSGAPTDGSGSFPNPMCQGSGSTSHCSLEEMLNEQDLADGEQDIPLEDIQQVRLLYPDLNRRREELRTQLRLKFDQFCSSRSFNGSHQ